MEFRLLGPLEVSDGTAPLRLGGRKQRALLARLLLDANRTVAVERLIDDLWGEDPPETAAKMVQISVSQLRKILPPNILQTRPPGYVLEVDRDSVDLHRFERIVDEGRAALAAGETAAAADLLREALQLWRGPALAEFSEPFAGLEGARLEELRLAALEERIEADLALARHGELVGELEALVARYPLRERLRGQLVLALYRSRRQAEALAAYQAFRSTLDEELGIEPSLQLKELERRILRQDSDLDWSAPATPARAPTPSAPRPATTRYARSGDVSIAYQVVGEGAIDLVLVHGWVCTFEPGWENPKIARFYRRLAAMGRLILFDKRGTGLSDRVSVDRLPDLETRMDDVRAVMDAVGSERAVLLGISEGGPMCTLFAATYPERTSALCLMGTFARLMWAPEYPFGLSEEAWQARLAAGDGDDSGLATTREWLERTAPEAARDEETLRWYISYVMRGASPGASRALRLMNREIDVRDVLPAIRVPTLVLYRSGEFHADATRDMGERIPGASIVGLPGRDHLPWEGDQNRLLDAIDRFLAGAGEDIGLDRVLATVLTVELVDDDRRELLDRYRAIARSQLARYRGVEVEAPGSRLLATFDGPARAIRCAGAIAHEASGLGLVVRAGLHTGEVELVEGSARGLAVQIGACVAAEAGPGELLVSQTVKDLVAGSGIEFEDRGRRALDGIPGDWQILAVTPPAAVKA
jgi:DNA-binding SARP family transcriptional activator/pimeloyl-ACP methyl ester carboxylesterase